jgi:hypothetical protein
MATASMGDEARLYGASIAIVSGTYSVLSATIGMASSGAGGPVMLVVGVVVLIHGIALLTPAAAAIGRASGPLMIAWAAIMFVNQLLSAVLPGWTMGAMSWDGGMVAIALIMLASGLIMSRRSLMA